MKMPPSCAASFFIGSGLISFSDIFFNSDTSSDTASSSGIFDTTCFPTVNAVKRNNIQRLIKLVVFHIFGFGCNLK